MAETSNIYASIFGETPQTRQARLQRDSAFQSMLDSRRQALEQQRTDDVTMARYNALGNLLTTMVQPLGWSVGGGRVGATGGYQPYDNRQYISAFNRAVKASDDLRNIGTMEGEYRFNLANEDYRRALSLEDEERRIARSIDAEKRKAEIQDEYAKQRHEYTMDEIAARGDAQKELAEMKAKYRVTRSGSRLSVDDRALITARNNYETYKRTRIIQGQPYMSFEQYMKGEGFDVAPAQKPATGSGRTTADLGDTKQSKSGGRTTAKL